MFCFDDKEIYDETFSGLFLVFLSSGGFIGGPAQGADKVIQEGKKLFEGTCADCHRINGQGLPDKFPALDKNPFVVGDPNKVIDTVLNGRKGKLGQMPTWKDTFSDQQLAAIITYVRQAWSNKAVGCHRRYGQEKTKINFWPQTNTDKKQIWGGEVLVPYLFCESASVRLRRGQKIGCKMKWIK